MKKVVVIMLVAAMLIVTSLAFAGGGQNNGSKGEGSTTAWHKATGNDGEAPGNVWWPEDE